MVGDYEMSKRRAASISSCTCPGIFARQPQQSDPPELISHWPREPAYPGSHARQERTPRCHLSQIRPSWPQRLRPTHPQQTAPESAVRSPRRGARSGAHLDPLGRRRSRPRGPARHPRPGRALLRGIFSGYGEDPVALLQRIFEEIDGYDEIVLLKDIRFESLASTTSRRSSARCTSPICPTTASSASRSWPGSSRSMPSGCRSRKR